MRLSQPFFQLPVLFDAARLSAEAAALPTEAWAPHPDRILGNSAVRLITVAPRRIRTTARCWRRPG